MIKQNKGFLISPTQMKGYWSAGIQKIVVHGFKARRLDSGILREFTPGENILLQPYVWAGLEEEAFTFGASNYGAPLEVLERCTT